MASLEAAVFRNGLVAKFRDSIATDLEFAGFKYLSET